MNAKYVSLLLSLAATIPQISAAALPCIAITGVTKPITASGRYCLTRDILSTTGAGIVIKADNVILDFAGHKLSTPVSTTSALPWKVGVDASYNQSITIMNGTLQGFNDGIILGEQIEATNNPGDYYVTKMKIVDIAAPGRRAIGIWEAGSNATITYNVIANVSGAEAYGLMIHGAWDSNSPPGRLVIKGNQIDRLTANAGNTAAGIAVDGGIETIINGNAVTEVISGGTSPNAYQHAYGLIVYSGFPMPGLVEVGDNYVWNSVPSNNSTGIRVNNGLTNVIVRDSDIGGFSTGLDLGGECVPFYLYNSISGAVTPYLVTGTPTPCGQGTKGPGNNP